LGDSSTLKSGQKVFAIGNMNSYGLSISQGVIGIPLLNLKTDDKDYYVIQAAITIAAGNSGGALIDESANLIGITSFRIKDN